MTWSAGRLARLSALTPEVAPLIREAASRVTVIGDLILDGWWSGHSDRISREAPAPVVDVTARVSTPGGAGNTAMNLAALGARVRLVGLVGDDDAGAQLVGILSSAGIDVSGVLCCSGARTMTKIRVMSDDHVLVRIDDGPGGAHPRAELLRLAEAAVDAAADADAELVCDYGFGTLHGPVRDSLVAPTRRRPPLTVVDAHDPGVWASLHPHLVTPNAREAARLLRLETLPADRTATVAERSGDLLRAAGALAAIITLDHDGTVLLRGNGEPHRTRAHPALETRASGAGDTFVAALTVAHAAGLSLELSADFAQLAADVVVQRYGTSVCTLDDITEQLGGRSDLALDHDELATRLAAHRKAGERIVFTNGCFDVLHRGHTTYLAQAKRLGDVLVVAINDDDSVRRLKGPDRPVNAAPDRANVLAALGCVDYVTVFDADTPSALLERLRPEIYVKGGDYTPEMLAETAVVSSYGGEVRMLGYVPSQSTSAVVARIRSTAPPSPKQERAERT
jgi:D-beta-D-heptose 7-phosphate kinase/D-beta-D-heptose 1-phosphate adenosyltransferase